MNASPQLLKKPKRLDSTQASPSHKEAELKVRREFDEAGISISEWARRNGFRRELVVQVLTGKLEGKRGQSHRIKVALGMKTGKVVDLAMFKPAADRGAT